MLVCGNNNKCFKNNKRCSTISNLTSHVINIGCKDNIEIDISFGKISQNVKFIQRLVYLYNLTDV